MMRNECGWITISCFIGYWDFCCSAHLVTIFKFKKQFGYWVSITTATAKVVMLGRIWFSPISYKWWSNGRSTGCACCSGSSLDLGWVRSRRWGEPHNTVFGTSPLKGVRALLPLRCWLGLNESYANGAPFSHWGSLTAVFLFFKTQR